MKLTHRRPVGEWRHFVTALAVAISACDAPLRDDGRPAGESSRAAVADATLASAARRIVGFLQGGEAFPDRAVSVPSAFSFR